MYLTIAIIVFCLCLPLSMRYLRSEYRKRREESAYRADRMLDDMPFRVAMALLCSVVMAGGWPVLIPLLAIGYAGYKAYQRIVVWMTA